MKVIRDDIWLCPDCMIAAVNGDVTGVEGKYLGPLATREEREAATDARIAEIWAGLSKLGPNLVPDFDSDTGEGHEEFSACGCDACGSRLAGEMHRFAILGEESADVA